MMHEVIWMILNEDASGIRVKRATRNAAPVYKAPSAEMLDGGDANGWIEATRPPPQPKRRILTARRKEIINKFLQDEQLNPGRHGLVGDPMWIQELTRQFAKRAGVRGYNDAAIGTTDVQKWLRVSPFAETVKALRTTQMHIQTASEPIAQPAVAESHQNTGQADSMAESSHLPANHASTLETSDEITANPCVQNEQRECEWKRSGVSNVQSATEITASANPIRWHAAADEAQPCVSNGQIEPSTSTNAMQLYEVDEHDELSDAPSGQQETSGAFASSIIIKDVKDEQGACTEVSKDFRFFRPWTVQLERQNVFQNSNGSNGTIDYQSEDDANHEMLEVDSDSRSSSTRATRTAPVELESIEDEAIGENAMSCQDGAGTCNNVPATPTLRYADPFGLQCRYTKIRSCRRHGDQWLISISYSNTRKKKIDGTLVVSISSLQHVCKNNRKTKRNHFKFHIFNFC